MTQEAENDKAASAAARPRAASLHRSASELRRFQANLSYDRTREISINLDPKQGQKLDETSRRVGRTFQLSMSLDVSFLAQFSRQSTEISSLESGSNLFDNYLNTTDQALSHSAEGAHALFDRVDEILGQAKSNVVEMLDGFLQMAAEQFGLTDDEAAQFEDAVVAQVDEFFDEVGSFLQDARQQTLTGFAAPAEDPVAPALAA